MSPHLQPREKLIKQGVDPLSDVELIQLLLGSGIPGKSVDKLALEVVELAQQHVWKLGLDQLTAVRGLSLAKSTKLLAAIELAKRLHQHSRQSVSSYRDLLPFADALRNSRQEQFWVFCLSGARQLICKEVVAIGTLDLTVTHPREIFYPAFVHNAASILIMHNHPSASCQPSEDDWHSTARLWQASLILGMPIDDHVILGLDGEFSFVESGAISS